MQCCNVAYVECRCGRKITWLGSCMEWCRGRGGGRRPRESTARRCDPRLPQPRPPPHRPRPRPAARSAPSSPGPRRSRGTRHWCRSRPEPGSHPATTMKTFTQFIRKTSHWSPSPRGSRACWAWRASRRRRAAPAACGCRGPARTWAPPCSATLSCHQNSLATYSLLDTHRYLKSEGCNRGQNILRRRMTINNWSGICMKSYY